MKLSLRWKILAWAFVNLALIAAGVFWFLRTQFSLGIHSLLAGPALLTRAIANLARNAARYAPGPLSISAASSGGEVMLIFADQGPATARNLTPRGLAITLTLRMVNDE